MRPTLVCCSGPYQRRHRPQEQQNGDGLLYKWTILNYSFEQKALSSFDLSISRGGPGNTGRGPFCGSNRARFAPEIVGILGPRGPRPAGKTSGQLRRCQFFLFITVVDIYYCPLWTCSGGVLAVLKPFVAVPISPPACSLAICSNHKLARARAKTSHDE